MPSKEMFLEAYQKIYLGPGRFRINEVGETQQTSINNNLRESSSVYLYTPTEVTLQQDLQR